MRDLIYKSWCIKYISDTDDVTKNMPTRKLHYECTNEDIKKDYSLYIPFTVALANEGVDFKKQAIDKIKWDIDNGEIEKNLNFHIQHNNSSFITY